jgi:RNA polymerase sigma factor (sigma-70 family)
MINQILIGKPETTQAKQGRQGTEKFYSRIEPAGLDNRLRGREGRAIVRRGLDQALDDYLVLLAQGGSREAFTRLVARWTPKLLAFAARALGTTEVAKDVVQDTWESAVRGLSRLDDPARFRAWIYAIAARKCADALRGKYRTTRIAQSAEAMSNPPPDAESDSNNRLDLNAAMKGLPPEQRIAVSLYFGEEMSVADIAAITGAPEGTVKSRLFAARKALRETLGELK